MTITESEPGLGQVEPSVAPPADAGPLPVQPQGPDGPTGGPPASVAEPPAHAPDGSARVSATVTTEAHGPDVDVHRETDLVASLPLTVPVSRERVNECIESARFWTEVLGAHADRLQKKSDTWSIMAGLLAAVAGLSVWKVVATREDWWAQLATSVLALSAAACAVVPRIKNYSETAGVSRELACRYGQVHGKLLDCRLLIGPRACENPSVRAVLAEFESIKKSKDSMRYVPVRCPATQDYLRRKRTPRAVRRSVDRTSARPDPG